jgi:hypothetical protein
MQSREVSKTKALVKSERSMVGDRMSHNQSREQPITFSGWEWSEHLAVENASVARLGEMESRCDNLDVPMTRIVSDRPSQRIMPGERRDCPK